MQYNKILNAVFKGQNNIMTPSVIERGSRGTCRAYEISSGIGLSGQPIYGVSVVDINRDGKAEYNKSLSELFQSLGRAQIHVKYMPKLSDQEALNIFNAEH